MKTLPEHEFTRDHKVAKDGTVTFSCSYDIGIWPWLALNPHHPIVIQTINYWASVEAAKARGTLDLSQWTALTQSDWHCGERGSGPLSHGRAETQNDGDVEGYKLTLYDQNDALVVQMSGKGVVFRNRDFEAWRASAKRQLAKAPKPANFEYAAAASVGVGTQKESLISPLRARDEPSVQALITRENGLMPGHPYHSGSGDHVNANHLADVALQFATALHRQPVTVEAGKMQFNRFIELDYPFEIVLDDDQQTEEMIVMRISQADRQCAHIAMTIDLDEN